MLIGLLFDRIVGGYDQHDQIHASRTGQHLANKFLMPWYVDDSQTKGRKIEVSIAQLDRNSPFSFFWETVGIHAGQGLDQRSLAVVDMAGSSQDKIATQIGFHSDIVAKNLDKQRQPTDGGNDLRISLNRTESTQHAFLDGLT
jgi:hypothetical protein